MKKKRKIKRKIYLIPLLIVVCFLSFFVSKTYIFTPNIKLSATSNAEFPKPDYNLSILMVGDGLIHSSVYRDAYSNGSYDFASMVSDFKTLASKYDLAYYNQETILGGTELGLSNYPRFNSPTEFGDAMVDAGFNLVSLATNHTMDMGETGVLKSVKYWNSKSNIVTAGQYDSFASRDDVKVYTKNGISYAFLSYTMWTNGLNPASGKEYLDSVYSEELAKEQIAKVRDKADVVIVAMHWGTEYSEGVSAAQEKEAKYLSSLGVDIIIGAHPHVVEPITYIDNTLVIYSLGNFISGQKPVGDDMITGLTVTVNIHKTVEDGKTKITIDEPHCELSYTYCTSNYRNFHVYPMSKVDASIFPNYVSVSKKLEAVVTSMSDKVKFMDLLNEDTYAK